MALATTLHSTSVPTPDPGGRQPGLSSRMASVSDTLATLLADLDPDTLLGPDAAALYAAFARVERMGVAGKTLLAPRIAASGHWEAEGHRSPAGLLAILEGGSAGQAKRTLETGQQLGALPSVEAALRQGRLSGHKAAEITDAAILDPRAETDLLAGAEHESLQATKERCQRARATATRHDPVAGAQRVHAKRHFSHWTDAEGAFCYQGSDTPERGAALLARLLPAVTRLRSVRRGQVTESTGGERRSGPPEEDAPYEPETALRADALFLLVTGSGAHRTEDDALLARGGALPIGDDPPSRSADVGLATAEDLVDRPAPATVVVRVDRDALVRGHAVPGELCELDGHGPIPVPLAKALAADAFLSLVFTEAGDIKAVSHLGRTINQRLRTALVFRDRTCVVPGCTMRYGLEIDHVNEMALGGATTLDNLALLCTHHHRLKTYEGWVLQRHGPTDEDPQWSFAPLPPFGQ